MKQLRKRESGHAVTFYYTDPRVTDVGSAVWWIDRARRIESCKAKFISLWEPSGGRDTRLNPDVAPEELSGRLAAKSYDRIYLEGTYDGVRFGLGVDMDNLEIAITVPDSQMKLIGMLVERLNRKE